MLCRLTALLVVVAALLTSARSGAEPFRPGETGWEGTSELLAVARSRLGTGRVELTATLDWSKVTANDGILILHPETDVDYAEASAFMRAGGRMAVLDDFGRGSRLLERFSIRRLAAPLRPARALRQNPNYAIAVPSVQQVAGHEQGRHPVVADVREIVTNHPTVLSHPNLTPVLEIKALGEPDATLAVTGVIAERGRLFVMGDPSALINLMMRYPGNRAFADGLVQYLVEEDNWGPRGGKLVLLTGDFRQRGSFGGESSLSRELGEYVAGFKDSVEAMHDDGLPDLIAILLAAGLVLVGVVWTGLTSTRPYKRTPPRYATGQPLVAQGGVAGRAAVLAAPTTHRALALIELKSALIEGMCHRMGLAPAVGESQLLAEIHRQEALSRPSSELVATMLAEMRKAELALTTGVSYRISVGQLERVRRDVMRVLDEASERLGGSA